MTSFFDSRRWAKLTLAVLVLVYAQLAWNARGRLAQGASDFAGNYSAARMVKDGQGDAIYDVERETAFLKQILDALNPSDRVTNNARAETLFFVNPPFTLWWILPLASLTYVKAFLLWDLVCLLCFAAGGWALGISKQPIVLGYAGTGLPGFPPGFYRPTPRAVFSFLVPLSSLRVSQLEARARGSGWALAFAAPDEVPARAALSFARAHKTTLANRVWVPSRSSRLAAAFNRDLGRFRGRTISSVRH